MSSPERSRRSRSCKRMDRAREHVPTRLRLDRDTLALIDATVAKARQEFDDSDIDRQLLELLLEHRLEDLKHDGGMAETRFSPEAARSKKASSRCPFGGRSSTTRRFGGWALRLTRGKRC